MELPYKVSDKLNAVQIHSEIRRLGPIGGLLQNRGRTYDEQSYKNIDEIFRLIQVLEPTKENGVIELWLCANRGTIEDFASHYGSYEENRDDGAVADQEEYTQYWLSEFPDEVEWYRFAAVEDKPYNYRAIHLGHRRVIEVREKEELGFPDDISAFTDWLLDAVRLTIEAICTGTYNDSVANLLPHKHRVGIIRQSDLWKVYPESKAHFFKNITEDEVVEFLTSDLDETHPGKLKLVTANDFYRFCAIGYKANNYEGADLPPKKQYYKHADGRDDGLKRLDPDSPEAFADWLENGERGGHPWEVCRGGNSTHISLYIRKEEDGYSLVVAGSSYSRCIEAIKFYLALKHAGLPVEIQNAALLKSRLRGAEKIGIVPQGVIPRYCSGWFPGENIKEFINLSLDREDAKKESVLAEWKPVEPVRMKDEQEDTAHE